MATKKKVAKKVTKKDKAQVPATVDSEEKITIPRLELDTVKITIQGMSPLLVNNFDEKTRHQLETDFRNKAKNKTQPKTAEEEYLGSLYYITKGKKPVYGVPASGIRKAAVSACRFVDKVPMTIAKGAFKIVSGPNGLIPVVSKAGPVMDTRPVRVGNFGNKKPATRRRARFDDWECTFAVHYNPGVMNKETLLNLFENAGFSVGLCEYRPEKDGELGMFRVKRG